MRFRLIGLLAVMAMIVAGCGGASPEAAGPSEGIQVHGDWTIDIYNEDGSLDQHVEFSNDLVPSGAQLVSEILAGIRVTQGRWSIRVSKGDPLADGDSPCGVAGASVGCVLIPENGLPGDGRLVLRGSFVAEIDGLIGRVGTQLSHCAVGDPIPCTADTTDFSQADVVDPNTTAKYQVSAGQQVAVEVEFSFTSG